MPNIDFFDFFVVLPYVFILVLSDVARSDSRGVFWSCFEALVAVDVRPQGLFRRLGISGTLHFSLLLWIACFLRMSITKSLLLGSRGVPYTRAADPFGDEILFKCQSRVKSLRIFSSITCFSASKYVSCALGSIAKGIIVALARLSRHGWVCFGYKVSGLGVAVCFSLCLERFAYFCPWLGVVFCFRTHFF